MVGRIVSIINLLCNTKKKEISIDSLSIGIDNQNELELWIRFGWQGIGLVWIWGFTNKWNWFWEKVYLIIDGNWFDVFLFKIFCYKNYFIKMSKLLLKNTWITLNYQVFSTFCSFLIFLKNLWIRLCISFIKQKEYWNHTLWWIHQILLWLEKLTFIGLS